MKCFQTIQSKIGVMGLIPSEQPNNGPQWNPRQIFCTVIYIADTLAMGLYVILEAEEIEEYMEASFSLTSVAAIEIAYISFIYKNDQLFNFFDIVSKEMTLSK